jgi:endonuclease YncB( thermonuclease family)
LRAVDAGEDARAPTTKACSRRVACDKITFAMGRRNRLNPLAIVFFVVILAYGYHGGFLRREFHWPWSGPGGPGDTVDSSRPVALPGSETAGQGERILAGVVERVADGDSLELRVGPSLERIRLVGIDAPEFSQPFGLEARDQLRRLCGGQSVQVVVFGRDRHGRWLADVYLRDRWVNGELVAGGYAWHFERWDNSLELAQFQAQARREGRGLWARGDALPPWEWRDQHRE